MLTQKPRGTADILPGEVEIWQHIEHVVQEICVRYHYGEVRTPMFEHTELFLRGVGETTDIVSKEMYTFRDRAERSLTLRPEGTAGVVRAYIENKLYGLSQTVKLFYTGPMFRYEKPQKGRFRQFHQYGCEAFGSEHPTMDAEVIALNRDLLVGFGMKDVYLELNSVGCEVCRPVHRAAMVSRLQPYRDRLCEDCRQRLEKNPLRIFDCKESSCQAVLQEANTPTITSMLCSDCSEHFGAVKMLLQEMNIPYTVDEHLVRGLDYYTRTAWEFKVPGYSTVAAGGRYNSLVAQVGGPETPGIGFAGGMERAVLVLSEQGVEIPKIGGIDVFVAVADESANTAAMRLLQQLRGAEIRAERDYLGKGLKAQFKLADRIGARYVAILGETELANQTLTLKALDTGVQEEMTWEAAVQRIRGGEMENDKS